jgi:hypothetical protein
MMLLNDDPIIGEILTLSHRIDKRRPAEGVLLYLVSVAFVAVATIVLFSVASISMLGTMLMSPRRPRSVDRKR